MRLLLDTAVLLWWLDDHPRLRGEARAMIASPDAEVAVSVASAWEIAIKQASGKLKVAADVVATVRSGNFRELPITLEHAVAAGALPRHHSDPFDRMLVAQAQLEGLTILTSDQAIRQYEVHAVSADR